MAQPTNSFHHFYVPNKKRSKELCGFIYRKKIFRKIKMYSDIYDLLFWENEIKNGMPSGHKLQTNKKILRVVLSVLDFVGSNSNIEICNHVTMWQFGKARCLCYVNRFNVLFLILPSTLSFQSFLELLQLLLVVASIKEAILSYIFHWIWVMV